MLVLEFKRITVVIQMNGGLVGWKKAHLSGTLSEVVLGQAGRETHVAWGGYGAKAPPSVGCGFGGGFSQSLGAQAPACWLPEVGLGRALQADRGPPFCCVPQGGGYLLQLRCFC